MRVSARGEYAIKAMLDLTLHPGRSLIRIPDIARRQAIPQRYLEQVLLLLKRAGLLSSKRGLTGGYQMARLPTEISVGEVLRAVDGGVTPVEVRGAAAGNGREGPDDLAELWDEVGRAISTVVDHTTFATLAERVVARRAADRAMYHI